MLGFEEKLHELKPADIKEYVERANGLHPALPIAPRFLKEQKIAFKQYRLS